MTVRRRLLLGFACGFILMYSFVTLASLLTSGTDLLDQWPFYYAAIAPQVYAGFCVLTAAGYTSRVMRRPIAIVVHLFSMPAVAFSLAGLGLLLPFAGILWYAAHAEAGEIEEKTIQ